MAESQTASSLAGSQRAGRHPAPTAGARASRLSSEGADLRWERSLWGSLDFSVLTQTRKRLGSGRRVYKLRWHGTTNNCSLNLKQLAHGRTRCREQRLPWPQVQHNGSTEFLRTSSRAELRDGAHGLERFSSSESGAAVLLSVGGVSPSPAKISEEKLGDLKNGGNFWTSPNGRMKCEKRNTSTHVYLAA